MVDGNGRTATILLLDPIHRSVLFGTGYRDSQPWNDCLYHPAAHSTTGTRRGDAISDVDIFYNPKTPSSSRSDSAGLYRTLAIALGRAVVASRAELPLALDRSRLRTGRYCHRCAARRRPAMDRRPIWTYHGLPLYRSTFGVAHARPRQRLDHVITERRLRCSDTDLGHAFRLAPSLDGDFSVVLAHVGAHFSRGRVRRNGPTLANSILSLCTGLNARALYLLTNNLRCHLWVAHLVTHTRWHHLDWNRHHLRQRRHQQRSGVAQKSTRLSVSMTKR